MKLIISVCTIWLMISAASARFMNYDTSVISKNWMKYFVHYTKGSESVEAKSFYINSAYHHEG